MSLSDKARSALRDLAKKQAEIAALPIQDQKREMWRRLNGLEKVRPLVWITEVPWHEVIPQDELICEGPFWRGIETQLRRTLYQWEHFACDMVIDGAVYCPYVFHDTGYGIEAEVVRPDARRGAADYVPVIRDEADIEKIQLPGITPDWDATERNDEMMRDVFADILPVTKRGVYHMWCAPWDILIQWWGIEELYRDIMDRPEFVHKGIGRMMDALLYRLDQLEEQGLLSVSDGNHRVGSGGPGITDQLPQTDLDGTRVRPKDQWGTSTGQIFSEVSPAMHDEFCLQYEKRWLQRFGLNCYGCCEPLHKKIGILRSVPNLRRISMSTWINVGEAAEAVGGDYVFSYKPNPAMVAVGPAERNHFCNTLKAVLDTTRGCVVELILKDIHTVQNVPRRLDEWAEVVMGLVEEYA